MTIRQVWRAAAVVVGLAVIVFVAGLSGLGSAMFGRGVPWGDVDGIRAKLAPDSRGVFDLLVALHGSRRGSQTDWAAAERLCRGLGWPKCDRPSLEELKRASWPSSSANEETRAALAVADATWAFGSEESARKMFRTELDRIPEIDGQGRARVLLRFGILDSNPDGQAALFNQACAASASLCDQMKEAAMREVRARFVPPGNVLPLYFGGGHPPIAGHR